MNIGIIFLTAVANVLLQVMSKNIIYAYVFVIYTLGAMAIDLFDKKYGKILVAAIFFAYAFLIVNCIYNHIIYDVILFDYIFVSIETDTHRYFVDLTSDQNRYKNNKKRIIYEDIGNLSYDEYTNQYNEKILNYH